MSVWFVEKTHIDVLVTAGLVLAAAPLDVNPNEAGKELWRENAHSICYRYEDEDGDALQALVDAYVYTPRPVEDIIFVLKQFHCYDYQTCEHPQYRLSPSYRFVRVCIAAIEQRVGATEEQLSKHPGYEQALWGVHLNPATNKIWFDAEEFYRQARIANGIPA